MKNRDHIAKEALIRYLEQDTDERFWQAINNFGYKYGLCKHFLCTTDELPDNDIQDLFFQESDRQLQGE